MNTTFTPDPHTRDARIHAIISTIVNGGGTFTRSAEPVDVTGRYVVGGVVPSVVVEVPRASGFHLQDNDIKAASSDGQWVHRRYVEEVLADKLDQFIRQHAPLRRRDNYIGTWYHEGAIHFDVVELWSSRTIAEEVGRERGELAIFDGTTFEDITL